MSEITKLSGWDVGVQAIKWTEKGQNGESPKEISGFALVFTETKPPTGNQYIFECRKEVADFIVERITGISVPGIHVPGL